MYAPQFGLDKQPFPSLPTGPEVFVSPQAAALVSGFRTACAANDAIITVSGPRGVGKTTLVKRALKATGLQRQILTIDGEPLQASEVLESLLMIFGVVDLPDDNKTRLGIWQQKLCELENADRNLFILIENATATGLDVIEELASLSAASDEGTAGARMIIMGDESLEDLAENTQLARFQRRVSLTHTVSPFSEAELRGYLKHSLRIAGGEFDALFDDDCVALLLQLGKGIPRTVNSIVDTVLHVASKQDLHRVTAKLIADVAAKAYDPATDDFEFKPKIVGASERKHSANNGNGAASEKSAPAQVPDLDALARAIAVAHGNGDGTPRRPDQALSASLADRPLILSDTARERTITCGMDSAEEFGLATDIVTTTLADAGDELEGVVQRLTDARTLEDVDDAMAETLFGSEFEQIAAVVTGKKQSVS